MSVSFADSNVFLYLALSEPSKADVAEALLSRERVCVSPQVISECANVLRRKAGKDWAFVNRFIQRMLQAADIRPTTVETSLIGLRLAERHGFSVWDSMIVASALEAGAEVLWTEDLHYGLVVDSRLRIANPFAE